jgi:hypothetical protein
LLWLAFRHASNDEAKRRIVATAAFLLTLTRRMSLPRLFQPGVGLGREVYALVWSTGSISSSAKLTLRSRLIMSSGSRWSSPQSRITRGSSRDDSLAFRSTTRGAATA